MSDTSNAGLAAAIDEFLGVLRKGIDAETFDEFVELDLTLTQMRAIFTLGARESALSINELAECMAVSVATAGRTVDRLMSLGMVDRREDPEDRRSKLVTLTATGRRLTEAKYETIRARIRVFARELPADVAAPLREAMRAAVEASPAHIHAGAACARAESGPAHE